MEKFAGRCPACWGAVTMTLDPCTAYAGRVWAGRCSKGHDVRCEVSKPNVAAIDIITPTPGPSPSIRSTKLAGKRR